MPAKPCCRCAAPSRAEHACDAERIRTAVCAYASGHLLQIVRARTRCATQLCLVRRKTEATAAEWRTRISFGTNAHVARADGGRIPRTHVRYTHTKITLSTIRAASLTIVCTCVGPQVMNILVLSKTHVRAELSICGKTITSTEFTLIAFSPHHLYLYAYKVAVQQNPNTHKHTYV